MSRAMSVWWQTLAFLRRQPKQLILTLIIFAGLIVSLIMIAQPWRSVRQVHVNSSVLSNQALQKDAQVTARTPWWQVFGQEAFIEHHMIATDPALDHANVTVSTDKVTLTVIDKMTTGYYQQANHWYAIDRNGQEKQLSGDPDGQAPIYVKPTSPAQKTAVAKAFASFDRPLRDNISQVIFSPDKTNPERIILNMSDGNTVYATTTTFAKKMPYYASMAKQMTQPGVIDLQFGAYSRPYHVSEKKKSATQTKKSEKSSNKNK